MPPPGEEEFDFVPDSAPQAAPAAEPLGFTPDPDTGTDAIPANHRETGRRMLVLPEVTFEVDVDRPSRTRTIEAPGQATELREVEKAVSKEGGGPDTRLLMTRLGAWALDGEPASQAFEPELRGAAETMDSFARGAREGAYLGFGDELGAGASSSGLGGPVTSSPAFGGAAVARSLLSRLVDNDPRYEREVARERAADAAAQERSPYAYAAGSIAGSSPTLAIPGSAPTALGRIGLAGLTGAGLGALRGAGESESDVAIDAIDRPSLARDALEGAALEGLASAGTAGAFEAASPVLRRLAGWARGRGLSESAARLRNAAAGARYAPETDRIDDPIRFAETVRDANISRGLRSTEAAGTRAAEVRREANEEISRLVQEARDAARSAPQAPPPQVSPQAARANTEVQRATRAAERAASRAAEVRQQARAEIDRLIEEAGGAARQARGNTADEAALAARVRDIETQIDAINARAAEAERAAQQAEQAARTARDRARVAGDAGGPFRAPPPANPPGTVATPDIVGALRRISANYPGQGAPSVSARAQIDDMARRYLDAYADEGAVPIDVLMEDWRAFGNPANFRDGQPWNVLASSRRDLRRMFRGLIEEAMETASGPAARQRLARALDRVHAGRTVERGARRVADRQSGNRLLSPTDYFAMGTGGMAGSFSGDPTIGLLTAAGAAGVNRAFRGREHALAATALEALAPRLRALGARGERWAQMLERARQQSPRSASAVHWMLLQTDPEYRAAVAQAQGQEGQENSQ